MNYLVNGHTHAVPGSIIFLIIVLSIWSYCWKIPAIWKSVKNDNKKWFIAFIFLNTLGILEIAYITYFSKKAEPKK